MLIACTAVEIGFVREGFDDVWCSSRLPDNNRLRTANRYRVQARMLVAGRMRSHLDVGNGEISAEAGRRDAASSCDRTRPPSTTSAVAG